MKRKLLINVSMNNQKSRSKAMKIVVGVSGVESAELKGDDKRQIEVIGDGVDAVALTILLRKKVGYAELVSVGAAGGGDDEKEKENKDNKENESKLQVWPHCVGVPNYNVHVITDYDPYPCSIL